MDSTTITDNNSDERKVLFIDDNIYIDSNATDEPLENRLTEAVGESNMIVLWGRSIPELITAAKLIADPESTNPKIKIISGFGVNQRIHDHDSDAVIVNMKGTTIGYSEQDHRIVMDISSYYTLCNDETKLVYVTEDDDEAISKWSILINSVTPFKVIKINEEVSLKSVHQFIEI